MSFPMRSSSIMCSLTSVGRQRITQAAFLRPSLQEISTTPTISRVISTQSLQPSTKVNNSILKSAPIGTYALSTYTSIATKRSYATLTDWPLFSPDPESPDLESLGDHSWYTPTPLSNPWAMECALEQRIQPLKVDAVLHCCCAGTWIFELYVDGDMFRGYVVWSPWVSDRIMLLQDYWSVEELMEALEREKGRVLRLKGRWYNLPKMK